MTRLLLAAAIAGAACTTTAAPPAPPPSTTVAPPNPHPPSTTAAPTTTTAAPTTTTHTHVRTHKRASRSEPRTEGMPDQHVTLACIRRYESGGNYRAVSRSGRHRGAYQFDRATFAANGGTGDPAAASVEEQDRVAATTLARRGLQPWPTPARRCR